MNNAMGLAGSAPVADLDQTALPVSSISVESGPSPAEMEGFRAHQQVGAEQAKNMLLADLGGPGETVPVARPGALLDAKAAASAFEDAKAVLMGGSPEWKPVDGGMATGMAGRAVQRFEKLPDGAMMRETTMASNDGVLSPAITRDVVKNVGGVLIHQHQPAPGRGDGSLTIIHNLAKGPSYRMDHLQTPTDWQNAIDKMMQFETQPAGPQ